MARVVRLTDNVILGLARMKNVRQQIPAFKALFESLGHRGCGRCKKKSVHRQREVLLALKKMLAENGSMVRLLKKITNADTIVIYVPKGKMVVKQSL